MIILQSICITIAPPITLPNTDGKSTLTLEGNYVAIPENGSDPRAYKLHRADEDWKADQPSDATVFIVVGADGKAQIS